MRYDQFKCILPINTAKQLLGYPKSIEIPVEVQDCLAQCRAAVLQAIHPIATLERYSIEWVEGGIAVVSTDHQQKLNRSLLENKWLKGQLAHSTELVAGVLTLGPEVEQLSQEAFTEGDPLRGYIIDTLGTLALLEMQEQVWQYLIKLIGQEGLGLSGPYSPGGDGEFQFEQEEVFRLAHGSSISITLTDSGMMLPIKSLTFLYLIGHAQAIQGEFDLCRHCGALNCQYGKKANLCRSTSDISLTIKRDGTIVRDVKVPVGADLLRVLQAEKLFIPAPCGGQGTCGKCKVIIEDSTENDAKMTKALTQEELASGHRLACQVKVNHPLIVHLPPKEEEGVILTGGALGTHTQIHQQIRSGLGVAIDLGTTTIAAYLIDLSTGEELGQQARLNPQRQYGSDVVSRIQYTDSVPNGLLHLHNLIITELNDIISELALTQQKTVTDISEIVIVGNTVMIHLLLNKSCTSLGQAPYQPEFTGEYTAKAVELGIKIHPDGEIYIPTGLAGYVGSDITAGILASGLHLKDGYNILLDIGTNGEIVLGNRNRIYTCATAAGPAFEGTGIEYGTGAIPGAISEIQLNAEPIYKTIANHPPCGICGSGVLDGVAELVKGGIVSPNGRLDANDERVKQYKGSLAFTLVEGESPILLTQDDVRQVQLAKGAIRAGLEILKKRAGLNFSQIEHLYLAGGFGNYLRIESALAIGLLPPIAKEQSISLGNTAGVGAKLFLRNPAYRERARELLERIEYVELATDEGFFEMFVEQMALK